MENNSKEVRRDIRAIQLGSAIRSKIDPDRFLVYLPDVVKKGKLEPRVWMEHNWTIMISHKVYGNILGKIVNVKSASEKRHAVTIAASIINFDPDDNEMYQHAFHRSLRYTEQLAQRVFWDQVEVKE